VIISRSIIFNSEIFLEKLKLNCCCLSLRVSDGFSRFFRLPSRSICLPLIGKLESGDKHSSLGKNGSEFVFFFLGLGLRYLFFPVLLNSCGCKSGDGGGCGDDDVDDDDEDGGDESNN